MRHLTVSDFGTFVGVSGMRLVVSNKDEDKKEFPLSHLRSITIAKKGVSFSSDLILECAARGIRLYFTDWRGVGVVALSPLNNHATYSIRQAQFELLKNEKRKFFASEIICTKIRNQRAVLLYFSKYLLNKNPEGANNLKITADSLKELAQKAKSVTMLPEDSWSKVLLGIEGSAAKVYWRAIQQTQLLPDFFQKRIGRGAIDPVNSALNYAYAILQSYVHSALENAGFELFLGLYHESRPGKPSLILDVMEEYRPWVVDRTIIKIRTELKTKDQILTQEVKKRISTEIANVMCKKLSYKNKKCKLENILQRQAYRLAGAISEGERYSGFKFKW